MDLFSAVPCGFHVKNDMKRELKPEFIISRTNKKFFRIAMNSNSSEAARLTLPTLESSGFQHFYGGKPEISLVVANCALVDYLIESIQKINPKIVSPKHLGGKIKLKIQRDSVFYDKNGQISHPRMVKANMRVQCTVEIHGYNFNSSGIFFKLVRLQVM